MLEHDENLFRQLSNSAKGSEVKASSYWQAYTDSIETIIQRDGLSGFGTNYFLTQAFGDALKTDVPRQRLRKLLKFPVLFRPIEKLSVILRYGRLKKTLFEIAQGAFIDKSFVKFLANEIDESTTRLKINRYIWIKNRKVPWRYLVFLQYIEMLRFCLDKGEFKHNVNDILNGNYLDIGGGYGSTVDGVTMFKKFYDFGEGTSHYLLDQFPVSYIANQYLKHRQGPNHLNFIEPSSATKLKKNKKRFTAVLQNTSLSSWKNLGISFFFNSNSFQEMDFDQVQKYCDFIEQNKGPKSFLGIFVYHSEKDHNDPQKIIDLLKGRFLLKAQVSSYDFYESSNVEHHPAMLDGVYYLFSV